MASNVPSAPQETVVVTAAAPTSSNSSNSSPKKTVNFESTLPSKIALNLQPFHKRKFSFPAALHANLLGLPASNGKDAKDISRRRFSNVGDVVTRKLSTTIGWRTPSVPPQEVIAQGKVLCSQYIRSRLKRNGIYNKKLGLYRLRSVIGTPNGSVIREVFPGLIGAGLELERLHPKVYSSVARQASSSPGGALVSDKAVAALFVNICRELMKNDMSWAKVVSIFAVAGGLAVDCVCQGHPEYVHGLMDGMIETLEEDLAEWVAANGGWNALGSHCRPPDPQVPVKEYVTIFTIAAFAVLVLAYSVMFLLSK